MIRLKKFAKAATEKHLSPEDTDLIEVTLTTLLGLDKLLHLLRARSDTLDLLGLRLTWEEQRIGAWKDRRKLLDDLRSFLVSRARWSPASYDALAATIANGNGSSSSIDLAVLNRSARFKHTEMLSHDAAQFTGRAIALRNAYVTPAGKTLDKLIEASTRGPVPDEILDEQDRVEDQCIVALEGLGKFAINTVMQWKRADELYGELKKDQLTADALEAEIRNALLSHPTLKLDVAFSSRAQALVRRLQLIGDPKSISSSFPRPVHPLFPDQQAANDSVSTLLSDELQNAMKLARLAEAKARQYHTSLVAVQRVEAARAKMVEVTKQLNTLATFFQEGDPSQPEGSLPDLSAVRCLEPVAHSAFLAMLPSMASRMPSLETAASRALHETESSLLTLPSHGIDSQFRSATSQEKDQLIQARYNAVQAKSRATSLANDLKAARGVWTSVADIASDLDSIQEDILSTLNRQRWRSQLSSNGAPLTPESPPSSLPPVKYSSADINERIATARQRIGKEVTAPLHSVSPRLPATLAGHLQTTATTLRDMADGIQKLTSVWDMVARQAEAMKRIHYDVHALEDGIDAAKLHVTQAESGILAGPGDADTIRSVEAVQEAAVAQQRQLVQSFVDKLASRVPLVTKSELAIALLTKAIASADNDLLPRSRPRRLSSAATPPDLAALDTAVRSDANGLAMNVTNSLHSLEAALEHLKVAGLAISADRAMQPWLANVRAVEAEMRELQQTLASLIADPNDALLARLVEIKETVAGLSTRRAELSRSRSPVRDAVQRMQAAAGALGSVAQEEMVLRRVRSFEDGEHRLDALDASIFSLADAAATAHANEVERLRLIEEERLRKEEEERLRLEEEERLRREEEERLRREEEERLRQEEEERLRREEEERLRREEEERLRLEEEERLRLEEERLRREEERLRLKELERFHREEEQRVEAERQRLAEEERLRKEEEEERLRREEQERLRLAEEARIRDEEEAHRVAKEEALRAAAEERARLEAEAQRLREEERRLAEAAERARLEAQEAREREAVEERRRKEDDERLRAEEMDRVVELNWDHQREIDDRSFVDHGESLDTVEEDEPGNNSFAFPSAPSPNPDTLSHQAPQLRAQLRALRIREMAKPLPGSTLAPYKDVERVRDGLAALSIDIVATLGAYADGADDEVELLRHDWQQCSAAMPRLQLLGKLADRVVLCDNALSDLLEHVDCYPVAPTRHLLSNHRSDQKQNAQEQLQARITFTKQALEDMQSDFNAVADDACAVHERDRILQTWNELYDMSVDRLSGQRSRAPSVAESSCSASSTTSRLMGPPLQSRPRNRSTMSMGNGKPMNAVAALATPRRASKGSTDFLARPASKMSIRSVSGPMSTTSTASSLHSSTFASRQRTTSLSSQASSTPQRRASGRESPVRAPSSAARMSRRVASPSPSLSSTNSKTSPRSTFARAPRFSFSTPAAKPKRKPYVPNSKSKLDVAVGEVMNKLPEDMAIHMEPVGYKDNSGKYWIGDADPKLCFCRILRSQTVMVRVGGGWVELSKFIKNHFVNLYRLMPEPTTVQKPSQEEKWISSTTLLQTGETPGGAEEGWKPPKTPEPRTPHMPSFSLSTPNGTSPRSIPSSGGSPLTPLQFMRRAEEHLVLPPATPGRSPSRMKKAAPSVPSTPARPVWRP
ncbi:hypothetical protein AURDEDRAFT_110516 [Auricularia subglabra TFB-10046 SS5]|nr:hypothetical protein AURDEDRAFT_110516 [Auricularia subglabra TFB-10046 SS5]